MTKLALALVSCVVLGCKSSTPAPEPTTPGPTEPAPTDSAPTEPGTTPTPGDNEATITGTIVAVDYGCRHDASCDVTLDGDRKVHFGHDTRRQGPTEWGDLSTLWPLANEKDQGVGRKVEVFGAITGEGTYTVEGKKDYYIRVVP
jgi:hypothetical protein